MLDLSKGTYSSGVLTCRKSYEWTNLYSKLESEHRCKVCHRVILHVQCGSQPFVCVTYFIADHDIFVNRGPLSVLAHGGRMAGATNNK